MSYSFDPTNRAAQATQGVAGDRLSEGSGYLQQIQEKNVLNDTVTIISNDGTRISTEVLQEKSKKVGSVATEDWVKLWLVDSAERDKEYIQQASLKGFHDYSRAIAKDCMGSGFVVDEGARFSLTFKQNADKNCVEIISNQKIYAMQDEKYKDKPFLLISKNADKKVYVSLDELKKIRAAGFAGYQPILTVETRLNADSLEQITLESAKVTPLLPERLKIKVLMPRDPALLKQLPAEKCEFVPNRHARLTNAMLEGANNTAKGGYPLDIHRISQSVLDLSIERAGKKIPLSELQKDKSHQTWHQLWLDGLGEEAVLRSFKEHVKPEDQVSVIQETLAAYYGEDQVPEIFRKFIVEDTAVDIEGFYTEVGKAGDQLKQILLRKIIEKVALQCFAGPALMMAQDCLSYSAPTVPSMPIALNGLCAKSALTFKSGEHCVEVVCKTTVYAMMATEEPFTGDYLMLQKGSNVFVRLSKDEISKIQKNLEKDWEPFITVEATLTARNLSQMELAQAVVTQHCEKIELNSAVLSSMSNSRNSPSLSVSSGYNTGSSSRASPSPITFAADQPPPSTEPNSSAKKPGSSPSLK